MPYDLAGQTLREKVLQRGQVLQDNLLSHDALGRLAGSADHRARLQFSYDRAGNRIRMQTYVQVPTVADRDVETVLQADRWFTFDGMNRQTAVDAVDASGRITSTQGRQLGYDLDGNRTSDRFWGNKVLAQQVVHSSYDFVSDTVSYAAPVTVYSVAKDFVTESYVHDAADRLLIVRRDGLIIDQRRYDAAGRLVQSAPVGLPAGYAERLNEGVAPAEQLGAWRRRMVAKGANIPTRPASLPRAA